MRLTFLLLLLLASPAAALEPKDVFVVANKNVPASGEVARHYLAKRADELAKDKAADPKERAAAAQKFNQLETRRIILAQEQSHAAVDSELMLLWWDDYPLARWVANPLYFRASETYRKSAPPVVLTSRLDGPSPEIAKRLVDDAVAVEAKGLTGSVVVDARGMKFDPKGPDAGLGYAGYDESMREMAKLLEKAGLTVTIDDNDKLLPRGSAKGVAR